MKPIPLLTPGPPPPWAANTPNPFHADLYAMYSSLYRGITTDPQWMIVPIDDHLVHRGDGVFETLKACHRRIFLLEPHLDRLIQSAASIHLPPPVNRNDLIHIVLQTVRAARRDHALIRILLSRGPGSMGISPADCPQPALYVIVHRLPPPFMDTHPHGATAGWSTIPVKSGHFATIKTCNYLPNALMKHEALHRQLDFIFARDEQNHLAEGPTENVAIVDADRRLLLPRPGRILPGTTLRRSLELAQSLLNHHTLTACLEADITSHALQTAREILIFGTTANVTAVTRFEGQPVGDGQPGPVYHALSRLLLQDLHDPSSPSLTPVP
ncbi:MAG TPA: aminotransferase class IV [Kiritimatiellia bacterium]|nr:aminotransferase class IV [Kiritimatiellia bacterium]